MGDYDFNDFVMNYSYELEKGNNNMITALKLTFTPIAKGAASWTHIGVGIELPLSADNIDKAKSEGATLEEGNDLSLIHIFTMFSCEKCVTKDFAWRITSYKC